MFFFNLIYNCIKSKSTSRWEQQNANTCCVHASRHVVYTHTKGPSIGPVAQWIRHRPTEPGIAGSSPAGVILIGTRTRTVVRRPSLPHLTLPASHPRILSKRVPFPRPPTLSPSRAAPGATVLVSSTASPKAPPSPAPQHIPSSLALHFPAVSPSAAYLRAHDISPTAGRLGHHTHI